MDGGFSPPCFLKKKEKMDALPSIIPKSIVKALDRLENDVGQRGVVQSQDSVANFAPKLPTIPRKVTVRRRRKKKSALACSRKMTGSFYTRTLIAAVPGFSDTANSLCVLKVTT